MQKEMRKSQPDLRISCCSLFVLYLNSIKTLAFLFVKQGNGLKPIPCLTPRILCGEFAVQYLFSCKSEGFADCGRAAVDKTVENRFIGQLYYNIIHLLLQAKV
jgi:hypothetical protein